MGVFQKYTKLKRIVTLTVSPLNSVPKRDSVSRRFISDLSFPKELSVNSGIYKDLYLNQLVELTYPSVDSLVAGLKEIGTDALIFKKDLAKAYRQFSVDPGDIHLLGYSWKDEVFIDVALAMGIRSAAHLCQRVTNAISYLCKDFTLINYLDDLCAIAPRNKADQAYKFLTQLLNRLGLKESIGKAVIPAVEVEFLGVLFNAKEQTISVSPSRLLEIHELLESWGKKKSASKRELQSLIGKLQFVSKCVLFSRIFISRLLLVLSQLKRQHHRFRPSAEFKRDIRWWVHFMKVFNGITFFHNDLSEHPDTVMSTDACLTGGGGWAGTQYFKFRFPEWILEKGWHINSLELLVIMVAVKLWGFVT